MDNYMYGDMTQAYDDFWKKHEVVSSEGFEKWVNTPTPTGRDYIGEERRRQALQLAIAWGGAGASLIELAKEIETYISNG